MGAPGGDLFMKQRDIYIWFWRLVVCARETSHDPERDQWTARFIGVRPGECRDEGLLACARYIGAPNKSLGANLVPRGAMGCGV